MRELGYFQDTCPSFFRDMAWSLAYQGRFKEAHEFIPKGLSKSQELDPSMSTSYSSDVGFLGVILMLEGRFDEAERHLRRSLSVKQNNKDFPGIPETLNWLGHLHARQELWEEALDYYQRSIKYNSVNKYYFESEALIGICCAQYCLGTFDNINETLDRGKALAQRFEYNDHLAMIYLLRGHIAWDAPPGNQENGFDFVLTMYQKSLIYGLRYNRFLLDAILDDGGLTNFLEPIIPYCLNHGILGRKMLTDLRDWWGVGFNRSEVKSTVSPIPPNISLLEAERLARDLEPGDGSRQINFSKRVDHVL
jgi:tetratricopeptide (TPR) repeat protein